MPIAVESKIPRIIRLFLFFRSSYYSYNITVARSRSFVSYEMRERSSRNRFSTQCAGYFAIFIRQFVVWHSLFSLGFLIIRRAGIPTNIIFEHATREEDLPKLAAPQSSSVIELTIKKTKKKNVCVLCSEKSSIMIPSNPPGIPSNNDNF